MMIENTQGQVALKHLSTNQKLVTVRGGKQYVFVPRANISMAWVEKDDVSELLSIKKGCCGGKKAIFRYANVDDVRRWTNGGGR